MRLAALVGAALLFVGCDDGGSSDADAAAFPGAAGGKADAFGRSLVGVADPYPADSRLEDPEAAAELDDDPYVRRQQAWRTVVEVLRPVPLLGLSEVDAEHEVLDLDEVPHGPRFATWYGGEELRRMLREMLVKMSPEDRATRRLPTDTALEELMVWNSEAIDRSDRWPLDRYLEHVSKLDDCEDEDPQACALELDAKLGGAVMGVGRVAYGPLAAGHALRSWGRTIDCLDELDTVGIDAKPKSDDDFTQCLSGEMPFGSVVIKAQWDRVGFSRTVPAFDTDADALKARLDPSTTLDWGDQGDRRADPEPSDIYTIELRNGSQFRLTGLHIMTKELRHWQWITLWWSDSPDSDFGEDRPTELVDALPPVWRNYKMCVTTSYLEEADDPGAGFDSHPSLQTALRAAVPQAGGPSWCSNPYLEHGRGNAATNCIGCHQHAGATVASDWDEDGMLDPLDLSAIIDDPKYPSQGREPMRELFPTDYVWSYGVGDDLLNTFAAELAKIEGS